MSILKILIYPHKNLRKKTKSVKNFDFNLKKNIKNMFETMNYNKGIGLAAIQVNIHKSIIVIDKSINRNKKLILINPKIIKKKGTLKLTESCLSIPNFHLKINRFKYIIIETLNTKGKKLFLNAQGLLSICIQHEIDHLNGKLFIDYIKNNFYA